jgi:hypothetical protein
MIVNVSAKRVLWVVLPLVLIGGSLVFASIRVRGQARPPLPPGLLEPTAAPDTTGLVDAAGAAARLAAVSPRFASVLAAVQSADTDAFLQSINWEQQVCGQRRDVYCPGIASGTQVDVFNVGVASFLVTADALRPSISSVLSGEPLKITFASRLRDNPNRYYVGLESRSPKPKAPPPVGDPDSTPTGLFLTLDATAANPIVEIDLSVNTQSHATDKGLSRNTNNQDLITFATPPPASSLPTSTPVSQTPVASATGTPP